MERSSIAMEGGSASSPFTSPGVLRRKASYRALGSLSPASGVTFSCGPPCEEEPRHFLDACFLCQRPLCRFRDIFMYRGDTPFCSEDCRQEQIDLDLAREEEEASYLRSTRRNHRVGDPAVAPSQVQSIRAQAAETTVTG